MSFSQWMNSVPLYVRKRQFMYEAINLSSKYYWNIITFSYIKRTPLEHLSYINEISWNTSGHTKSGTDFIHCDFIPTFLDDIPITLCVKEFSFHPKNVPYFYQDHDASSCSVGSVSNYYYYHTGITCLCRYGSNEFDYFRYKRHWHRIMTITNTHANQNYFSIT